MAKKIIIFLFFASFVYASQEPVNRKNKKFYELFQAAVDGDCKTIRRLIKDGVDPNQLHDIENVTPLIATIYHNHIAATQLLIDSKADLELKSHEKNQGATPLSWAVDKKKYRIINLLLDKYNADIECKTIKFEHTPLAVAVIRNDSEIVRNLVNRKADIHVKNKHGNPVVQLAILNNADKTLKLLLELNADLNVKGEFGNIALHMAAQRDNKKIFKFVLSKSDVNAENDYGATALHVAVETNKTKYILQLIKAGAKVDYKNKNCIAPLSFALDDGRKESARLLINNGADFKDWLNEIAPRLMTEYLNKSLKTLTEAIGINYTDQNGQNLLHWAAEKDDEATIRALLDLGLSYDQRDCNDQTPSDIAFEKKNYGIAKVIADHQRKLFKSQRKEHAKKALDAKIPTVLTKIITDYMD